MLARLARNRGYKVAGLLAEALYHDGMLVGFDAVDLQTAAREPLARFRFSDRITGLPCRDPALREPKSDQRKARTGGFTFLEKGLGLGASALDPTATRSADLIVVDEFGPLELNGQGWRKNVDILVESGKALLLLVVRQRLGEQVQRLYARAPSVRLAASEAESIQRVLSMLSVRRQSVAGSMTSQ